MVVAVHRKAIAQRHVFGPIDRRSHRCQGSQGNRELEATLQVQLRAVVAQCLGRSLTWPRRATAASSTNATPSSSFDSVCFHPRIFAMVRRSFAAFPIITLCPAHSSISTSFQLSPMAIGDNWND